ncbi:MAG TPA: TIGR01777 family oxidoreductase [Chloroflexaceae bacterium]|nr:TIGR01777 family oxidoreductase [Chloroflexaceae bacterium]
MSNAKRIILTGATGLIGGRLFKALREGGYEVVIFSRDPAAARRKLPGAADYVAWTPAESGPWAAALDGAHAVIHLAGAPISQGLIGVRWTKAYKREIESSRVVGTRGIVAAIAAASRRPAVLVSASAIGYYGPGDDTPRDETAPPGDDFQGRLCVAWEGEALRAEELGVRVARVRTGIVLDPNEGALGQLLIPFRLRVGGPIMPGSQYYSWIHPDDVVGIFMLALEDERLSGPINATAPNPVTNRDFCATIGRVVGSPSWLPVPAFSLRLALGEMADLVVKGSRVLPRRAQELGYQFTYPELEPALRDLLG